MKLNWRLTNSNQDNFKTSTDGVNAMRMDIIEACKDLSIYLNEYKGVDRSQVDLLLDVSEALIKTAKFYKAVGVH